MKNPIDHVYDIVSLINPFDELEKLHREETIAWIKSGEPIFRIEKPDFPKQHLVSYFILIDEKDEQALLVDHKKSGLWLPAGGHVEINECPKETVKRECLEELDVEAEFILPDPIFLTKTMTVGLTAGHVDVSLWYVLKGNRETNYVYERQEFNDIGWFSFDSIPYHKSDIHMQRFISKLRGVL